MVSVSNISALPIVGALGKKWKSVPFVAVSSHGARTGALVNA